MVRRYISVVSIRSLTSLLLSSLVHRAWKPALFVHSRATESGVYPIARSIPQALSARRLRKTLMPQARLDDGLGGTCCDLVDTARPPTGRWLLYTHSIATCAVPAGLDSA